MKSISTSVPNWPIRVKMAEHVTTVMEITSVYVLPGILEIDVRLILMIVDRTRAIMEHV